MNRGKLLSGIAAFGIYLGLIFLILFFYNIHKTKAKNYVEKNSDRVTVTLVNSDKTVLNRSDKVSNSNKPTPTVPSVPIPVKKVTKVPKKEPKKIERSAKPIPKAPPKKVEPKKVEPKKEVIKKEVPKKVEPKKVVPKKIIKAKEVVPKKEIPKKETPKKEVIKKEVPKRVEPKKEIPVKETPPKKTQSAKDLFSSVKTNDVVKTPVKTQPKESTPVKEESAIKHNSSMTDRIKNSHQSGTVSNANREKGVENAYIAKVKRHMNNWNAESIHKGQRLTLELTIYSSGKFEYRIVNGGYGNIQSSLSTYLESLNRIGLGRHSKSTPYSIKVDFTVR